LLFAQDLDMYIFMKYVHINRGMAHILQKHYDISFRNEYICAVLGHLHSLYTVWKMKNYNYSGHRLTSVFELDYKINIK